MPKTKTESRPYTHYHADGSVWAKGRMREGKMDSYWEWFRRDGMKMRSGSFTKGKQVGEWITYDKKSRIVKKTQLQTKK